MEGEGGEKKKKTCRAGAQQPGREVYSMGPCGSGADDVFQWNSSIIEF